VLHHLEQRLSDSRNAVILADFRRKAPADAPYKRVPNHCGCLEKTFPLKAEIVAMGQFSAHAGKANYCAG